MRLVSVAVLGIPIPTCICVLPTPIQTAELGQGGYVAAYWRHAECVTCVYAVPTSAA